MNAFIRTLPLRPGQECHDTFNRVPRFMALILGFAAGQPLAMDTVPPPTSSRSSNGGTPEGTSASPMTWKTPPGQGWARGFFRALAAEGDRAHARSTTASHVSLELQYGVGA